MNDDKKPAPPTTAAERKALRTLEAQQAIADHEQDEKAFHANRERLKAERQAREAIEGPKMAPAPEISDTTPIDRLLLPARVHKALNEAGVNTVGEIRAKSDQELLAIQKLGNGSVTHLRKTLGAPSGLRPVIGKRT